MCSPWHITLNYTTLGSQNLKWKYSSYARDMSSRPKGTKRKKLQCMIAMPLAHQPDQKLTDFFRRNCDFRTHSYSFAKLQQKLVSYTWIWTKKNWIHNIQNNPMWKGCRPFVWYRNRRLKAPISPIATIAATRFSSCFDAPICVRTQWDFLQSYQ